MYFITIVDALVGSLLTPIIAIDLYLERISLISLIIFFTDDLVFAKSYFIRFEIIPITVKIQDDSDEATKSVGEKASPFPLLSVGASVIILSLEDIWTDSVLRFPK